MSWQIHCIENTVEVSEEVAQKIFSVGEGEYFEEPSEVRFEGLLQFNSDHCEHQDYVSREEVIEILKAAKVKGRIAWMDVEQGGPDGVAYWAHEFDGKGGYKSLDGKAQIAWTEVPRG